MGTLIWLKMSLLMAGGWSKTPLKVASRPNYSMISGNEYELLATKTQFIAVPKVLPVLCSPLSSAAFISACAGKLVELQRL